MRKTYRFTVAMHEDYGTLGFKPSWYPNGDPLSGMAVAHDILEHFPKDDGRAEGEYMALGASLFIRGDMGEYRNGSGEENVAADIPTVLGIQSTVRPCGLSKDSDLMERSRSAVAFAKKELFYREETLSDEQAERIARWIAKGYQKARKRYQGKNWAVCQVFREIAERADRELKHAEEGMVLTVAVNLKRCEVSVSCDYSEEFF